MKSGHSIVPPLSRILVGGTLLAQSFADPSRSRHIHRTSDVRCEECGDGELSVHLGLQATLTGRTERIDSRGWSCRLW